MWEFKVLVFGPGLDAAGVRARVSFQEGAMVVRGRRVFMTVAADRVRLKPGGFNGRQWMLAWPGEDGEVTAMLQGETEMRLLSQYAPPALAGALTAAVRQGRWRSRRFRLLLGALLLFLLLPLLLLVLFWFNAERIAGWASQQVDADTETRIGQLAFDQMRPSLQLIDGGPATDMVRRTGARLTQGSAYSYHWFVSASPEVNAFALPGGYVIVNAGLIRAADSAEEVAAVLAHEVQHVEARHALKNILHGLGWRAALSLALGDVGGGVWLGLADQLGSLRYSRDLEREADRMGLEALRRAGIAPGGMASFFARLAAAEGPGLPLLSSHPASEQRLRDTRQAIAAMGAYATTPLRYDWPAMRASLAEARQ